MKKLIPAAALLNIAVKDHIVICEDEYVSMQEFGLLPPYAELIKEAEKEREKEIDEALEAAERQK